MKFRIKKWAVVLGAVIASLIIGFTVAWASGTLVVHFGGGAQISGTVHIVAPDPTVEDIVILYAPDDITVQAGQGGVYSSITVQNNSAYPLTFVQLDVTFPDYVAAMGVQPVVEWDHVLPAHGTQEIPVLIAFDPAAPVGDYTYEGDITYSW